MRSPLRRTARRAVLTYSVRSRRRKAEVICRFIADHDLSTVVFVGTGGSRNPNEIVVERRIAEVARVIAACDLRMAKPTGWPYVRANGLNLPFADRSVDLVLSNAVIEHVGGLAEQRRFMAEHERVGSFCVVTTPNRWFPVEAHTATALMHWIPSWRASRKEFTRLLSRKEFLELLPAHAHVIGRPWSATFIALYRVVEFMDAALPPSGVAGHPAVLDLRTPQPSSTAATPARNWTRPSELA